MKILDASIIIPAFNSEKSIGVCVRACKDQVFKGSFEVIVVDDGSTDSTKRVAEEAGAIVFSQENRGPAAARNFGAKKSRGGILVFLDADCVPEKNWLFEMLKPFDDPSVVGVQGAYKSKQVSLVARFVQFEVEERYELMEKNARSLDWIGSYSAAYRRKDFFEVGGFDESFPIASGEDPDLSFRLAKAGKKLVFNRRAIVYHTHPETVWKYFVVKFYRAFYRVLLYSKHLDKAVKDSYTPNSVKIQIFAGYLGLLVTFLIPFLYFNGFVFFAEALFFFNLLVLSTIVTIVFSLRSNSDFIFVLFSMFMVQVRTLAFMLGLFFGVLSHLVGRRFV